jgi:hypothetical protein
MYLQHDRKIAFTLMQARLPGSIRRRFVHVETCMRSVRSVKLGILKGILKEWKPASGRIGPMSSPQKRNRYL